MEQFGAVLGITAKQREAKYQFKRISENLKQYVQEFHNPVDIIVLARDVKDPMAILNTSGPTALSNEDKKYFIMVMIQTEEFKQYVKTVSVLRQNVIKPALQSETEGYPDYITHAPK